MPPPTKASNKKSEKLIRAEEEVLRIRHRQESEARGTTTKDFQDMAKRNAKKKEAPQQRAPPRGGGCGGKRRKPNGPTTLRLNTRAMDAYGARGLNMGNHVMRQGSNWNTFGSGLMDFGSSWDNTGRRRDYRGGQYSDLGSDWMNQ
jgi:hypothetical protein